MTKSFQHLGMSHVYAHLMNVAPEGFLPAVYSNILGRPGDEAGYRNYAHLLAKGVSRGEIIAAIVGSPEAAEGGVNAKDPGALRLTRKSSLVRLIPFELGRRALAKRVGLEHPGDREFDWVAWCVSHERDADRPTDDSRVKLLISGPTTAAEIARLDRKRELDLHDQSLLFLRDAEPYSNDIRAFYSDTDPIAPRKLTVTGLRLRVLGRRVYYLQLIGLSRYDRDPITLEIPQYKCSSALVWKHGPTFIREFFLVPAHTSVQEIDATSSGLIKWNGHSSLIQFEPYDEKREFTFCAAYDRFALIRPNVPLDISAGSTHLVTTTEQSVTSIGLQPTAGDLIRVSVNATIWWCPSRLVVRKPKLYANSRRNFLADIRGERLLTLDTHIEPDMNNLLSEWRQLGDDRFMRTLYLRILKRNADEGGLSTNLSRFRETLKDLGAERAIAAIWASFIASDEFKELPIKYVGD